MKNQKRKISIFWAISFFLLLSSSSVFLINNIIAVNKLIKEVNIVKDDILKANQTNNSLKMEIEKLCSYDRVKKIAEEKLNLKIDELNIRQNRKLLIKRTEME
ncbi:MAG: cell division protein FtsL [Ignavibacteria bacterium]